MESKSKQKRRTIKIIVGILLLIIIVGLTYVFHQVDYYSNKYDIDMLHNQIKLGKNLKESDTGHVGEVIDTLINNAKWTQSDITNNKHFVKAIGTYDKGNTVEVDIYLYDIDIKNKYLSDPLNEIVIYENGNRINSVWALYTLIRNYNISKGIPIPSDLQNKMKEALNYFTILGIDYTKLNAYDVMMTKLNAMKNAGSTQVNNTQQQQQPQKTYKVQTYAPFQGNIDKGVYGETNTKYNVFRQSTLQGAPSSIQDLDQFLTKFNIQLEKDNYLVVTGDKGESSYRIVFAPDYNTNKLNIDSISIDEQQVSKDQIQQVINALYGYN